MVYTWLTSSQVVLMSEALIQWWTWLIHIAIQIMPYAIAFTIIMIVFVLVKNRSYFKTSRQLKKLHKNKTRKERAEIIWKTHYDYFRNWPTIYKDSE